MKRSKNWTWLALLGCTLCALATMAPAQELMVDLEIADVQVLVYPDKSTTFQILPVVNLWNRGNLLSHAIDITMTYGPIAVQVVNDVVTYYQDAHSCFNQPTNNCGGGTCLDVYSLLFGYGEGSCHPGGFLGHCGCLWVVDEYEFPETTFVQGYTTVTIEVDPNHLVPETDESNNIMTIDLGTIANDFTTWSGIKSMYR